MPLQETRHLKVNVTLVILIAYRYYFPLIIRSLPTNPYLNITLTLNNLTAGRIHVNLNVAVLYRTRQLDGREQLTNTNEDTELPRHNRTFARLTASIERIFRNASSVGNYVSRSNGGRNRRRRNRGRPCPPERRELLAYSH